MKDIIIPKLEGIYIHCSNEACQYTWRYKGRSTFYASCPGCRRNVRISENKIESLQPDKVESPVQAVKIATTAIVKDEDCR